MTVSSTLVREDGEVFTYSGGGQWSEPPPTSPYSAVEKPFDLLAVADMGMLAPVDRVALALAREAEGGRAQVLLHAGDLAYADYGADRWDRFEKMMGPVTSRLAYMPAIGNHDGIDEMLRRWGPAGTPLATRKMYYMFFVGPVAVIVLSIEDPMESGSEQYKFLEASLAEARKPKGRFVIVMCHLPMYSSSDGHAGPKWAAEHPKQETPAAKMRRLEPLLYAHRVNLVIAGDDHVYERSLPVLKGQISVVPSAAKEAGFPISSADGIVHVTVGTGGATPDGWYSSKPPIYTAARHAGKFGYLKISISSDEKEHRARCQFLAVPTTEGEEGHLPTVVDEFLLVEPNMAKRVLFADSPTAGGLVFGMSVIMYILLKYTGFFNSHGARAQQQQQQFGGADTV